MRFTLLYLAACVSEAPLTPLGLPVDPEPLASLEDCLGMDWDPVAVGGTAVDIALGGEFTAVGFASRVEVHYADGTEPWVAWPIGEVHGLSVRGDEVWVALGRGGVAVLDVRQRSVHRRATGGDITDIAAGDGVWAVDRSGRLLDVGGDIVFAHVVAGNPKGVALSGSSPVWVDMRSKLWRWNGTSEEQIGTADHVATSGSEIWTAQGSTLSRGSMREELPGGITALSATGDRVYALTEGGLFVWDGEVLVPPTSWPSILRDPQFEPTGLAVAGERTAISGGAAGWSLGSEIHAGTGPIQVVQVVGERLFVGTGASRDHGQLRVLDRDTLKVLEVHDTGSVRAVLATEDAVWFAGSGLHRYADGAIVDIGPPEDGILSLGVDEGGDVYVLTDSGTVEVWDGETLHTAVDSLPWPGAAMALFEGRPAIVSPAVGRLWYDGVGFALPAPGGGASRWSGAHPLEVGEHLWVPMPAGGLAVVDPGKQTVERVAPSILTSAWDVALGGRDQAWVALGAQGVALVSHLDRPRFEQQCALPGSVEHLAASADRVYAASGASLFVLTPPVE